MFGRAGQGGRLHTDLVSAQLCCGRRRLPPWIVWDVTTRQPRQQLRLHAQSVQGVGFSPDDNTLYTAGLDRRRADMGPPRRLVIRAPPHARDPTLAMGAILEPSGHLNLLRNRGGRRRRHRLRSLAAVPRPQHRPSCSRSTRRRARKHGGRTATASPPAMTGSCACSGTGEGHADHRMLRLNTSQVWCTRVTATGSRRAIRGHAHQSTAETLELDHVLDGVAPNCSSPALRTWHPVPRIA